MFRSRAFKLVDWLAEALFAALALAAVWKYRWSYLPILGSGLSYFCIAACLPLLSASKARGERARQNRILLAAGYLIMIISLLNFLAAGGSMNLRAPSIFWVVLISLVYALVQVLVVAMAFLDENFHLPVPQDARKLLSGTVLAAGIAWIFAVALAGGGLLQTHVLARESHSIPWNLYDFAMVFAALFSGMLGYVLTRNMGLPSMHRLRAVAILCGLLLATGLNEYFVRGNWLLFSLSSVALIGAFFASWEALAFASTRNSSLAKQVESQTGD